MKSWWKTLLSKFLTKKPPTLPAPTFDVILNPKPRWKGDFQCWEVEFSKELYFTHRWARDEFGRGSCKCGALISKGISKNHYMITVLNNTMACKLTEDDWLCINIIS